MFLLFERRKRKLISTICKDIATTLASHDGDFQLLASSKVKLIFRRLLAFFYSFNIIIFVASCRPNFWFVCLVCLFLMSNWREGKKSWKEIKDRTILCIRPTKLQTLSSTKLISSHPISSHCKLFGTQN